MLNTRTHTTQVNILQFTYSPLWESSHPWSGKTACITTCLRGKKVTLRNWGSLRQALYCHWGLEIVVWHLLQTDYWQWLIIWCVALSVLDLIVMVHWGKGWAEFKSPPRESFNKRSFEMLSKKEKIRRRPKWFTQQD